ncbi:MAG: hypothetical protein JWO30_2924 [Fibrobacteres bacterium]|nr:hypothetical protein [Fibrobacterota bacterium]
METLKSVYWAVRKDVPTMWFWLLSQLPGNTGIALRARLMPSLLGACGPGQIIQMNLRVANPEKLRIGSHCNFGQGVFITAGGGVTLGDYVGMGPDSKIWSVNHRFENPDIPWLTQGYESKEVVIGDDVWIGANAFIMPGVHIGKGTIISAGSVLSKSVPAYCIVAGNPGRVIGWRKKPEDEAGGGGKTAGTEAGGGAQ